MGSDSGGCEFAQTFKFIISVVDVLAVAKGQLAERAVLRAVGVGGQRLGAARRTNGGRCG